MRLEDRTESLEYKAIRDEGVRLFQSIAPQLKAEDRDKRLRDKYNMGSPFEGERRWNTFKVQALLCDLEKKYRGRVVSTDAYDFIKRYERWQYMGSTGPKDVKACVKRLMSVLRISGKAALSDGRLFIEFR